MVTCLWSIGIGFSAVFRFRGKSLQSDVVSLFWGQLMKMRCLNVHYLFYTQQRNEIYDMTNDLKIIISVRGGERYFLWSV